MTGEGEGEGKGFEQRHEHNQKLSLLLDNHLNVNEMIYCCVDANEKSFFFLFLVANKFVTL